MRCYICDNEIVREHGYTHEVVLEKPLCYACATEVVDTIADNSFHDLWEDVVVEEEESDGDLIE